MSKQPALDESSSPEEILLLTIGHEIMNFRPGFPKSSLKHTFVLSPQGSGMFGIKPQNNMLYLGIPKRFYEKFKSAKWEYVAKVEGQGGLYLIMTIGAGSSRHSIGIRVFIRSKRLEAMDGNIKSLRAVPMDKTGITRESDLLQGFNLKFFEKSTFEWEHDSSDE